MCDFSLYVCRLTDGAWDDRFQILPTGSYTYAFRAFPVTILRYEKYVSFVLEKKNSNLFKLKPSFLDFLNLHDTLKTSEK